jgi:predicted Fe-S protein YdhL (DUF1289 family)
VRLIGKGPPAFGLSGFDRVEGVEYAQSRLVQATAYRLAPGDRFRHGDSPEFGTTQYRSECRVARAKWASMTPTEQAAVVAAARQKKIADLSAMERYEQNNEMLHETAAQSAQLEAQCEAIKEAGAKLTPEQKKATTQ